MSPAARDPFVVKRSDSSSWLRSICPAMDPRSVASPGLVSAFMQKKRHDLLRDHDQMGKHDCYWRAKFEKRLGSPSRIRTCNPEFNSERVKLKKRKHRPAG